jgi:hypothetical protein
MRRLFTHHAITLHSYKSNYALSPILAEKKALERPATLVLLHDPLVVDSVALVICHNKCFIYFVLPRSASSAIASEKYPAKQVGLRQTSGACPPIWAHGAMTTPVNFIIWPRI